MGGLAFFPKGFRLAVAHYNGATLWFPNVKAEPECLVWKGSHLAGERLKAAVTEIRKVATVDPVTTAALA